ncbi:putative HNH endonuclease [Caulobacter phage CcrSwift]|uniref:Putative HNH endonuclease n=1 Tax=Caulobacter phage CcrSwift TaxID=2927984 RepID=K4K7B8_9CAUD|nr:HNH endonuclease [Caulobacter phage CcrSwift]AFU88522.1 putative HNH endonuclease [Caulobacter phage CcrSwift]
MSSSEVLVQDPLPPAAPNRRHRLFLEAGGLCTYCTGQMAYRRRIGRGGGKLEPDEVTIEHLEARAEGGSNHESNLAAACVACNNTKDNAMPAWEFRRLRLRLLPEWPPCTFPPLSVRRREPGLRPVSKRIGRLFDNIDNPGYWRRWFGSDPTRKVALVLHREQRHLAIKRRVLLEHLPGRNDSRTVIFWRFGPLSAIKVITGRSAAYEDRDLILSLSWVWRGADVLTALLGRARSAETTPGGEP